MSVTDQQHEQLRAGLRAMWGSVAPAWERHAELSDARARGVTTAMLDRAGLRPGDRVLELACGAAGLGLAAASRVAPGGEVVLSDVAPEMVAVARARAARSDLDNISVETLDLEAIAAPDESFDVVLCREGLMLVLDPALATREIHRVLRPGGRAVVSTWGPRASNPWLGLIFDAVSAELDIPMPPAGLPGPFALGDPGALAGEFEGGRWRSVKISEVSSTLCAPSLEKWWQVTLDLAGPLSGMLAALPPATAEAIRARALRAIEPYRRADGSLNIPGTCFVATGVA